ncbi:Aste57867_24427 [Aphanomyces stellatus]|uniref:Aste57867_24427 protein n=1 Tax=Aphanomyces stellatus TaxID=120398 RepID=A0A485LQM5_9STRA|nr:hypothetical protein As57867_024351 [Aphanomyces stellatus]VFU01067.1 Aste57867_24427 [Aphanomyces stellatus]
MPSKKKSKTPAAAPGATPAAAPAAAPASKAKAAPAAATAAKAKATPAAAPPAPVKAVPAVEKAPTVAELTLRLEVLAGGKEKMSIDAKAAEEELNRLLKNPKKRVQGKSDELDAEMKKLEFKRNTTSMTLNDEKKLLRDIDNIKLQKTELVEFEAFNERVQTLKDKKKSLFDTLKLAEAQEKEMHVTLRKIKLAEQLHTTIHKFETISVTVPKEKMGLVVGKGFAKLRQFEDTYHVLLDVENGSQVVKVTSTPAKNAAFETILDNIASASLHSVAVRPDTLKLLMIQKGKHLKALEAECFVKIDVDRAENVISFTASADRVDAVNHAIKVLTASSATLDVPQDVLPKLIGKKGEVISKIMEDSGALLDIDRVVNSLRITGPKESVATAKVAVEQLIYEQGALTVDVHAGDTTYFGTWDASKFPVFVEYLMVDKAANLRELRKAAQDCRLQVNKNKNLLEANGTRTQLEALKGALRAAVTTFEANIVSMDVDSNCLSLIIGKKGSKIKSIEQESGGARIDITGNTVSVLGTKEQMDVAVALIEEIVANNQRVVVHASSHLIPLLLGNKRAKLNELEKESKGSIQLPQAGSAKNKSKQHAEIAITITGTTAAIEKAARLIEELNQAHQVTYIPLDQDEVTVVIGKKGETIHKLEADSGCQLRVLDADDNAVRELELVGNEAQVALATAAIDALLNTSHRQVLTLDEFAMGVVIGRKGEQIKKLREACPGVTLDAFPHGQVRVKATTKELVDVAVAAVMELLQTTTVQETIKLPAESRLNFDAFYKDAAIALYISELEAEGGVKTTVLEGGKQVKIRGSALGLGKLKRFFESLGEQHVAVSIPLPSAGHVTSLKGPLPDSMHENVQQVMKQTKTVIRFKSDKKSYSGTVLSIEGPSMPKVLEAKQRVEVVLQFFFPKHFKVLQGVPHASVARVFQTAPLLAKYHAILSLGAKDAVKIFTDSEANTDAVYKTLQENVKSHLKEYKEVSIPGYLAPIVVGKNGEAIKRLSAESHATLTLSAADSDDATAPRTLTIHSKVEANIKTAVTLVHALLETYDSECVTVDVPLELVDLAISLKKKGPSNVSFTVDKKSPSGAVLKIHAKDVAERASALERVEELIANTTVKTIVLPTSDIVGTLIGKSGANIKALQSAHPGLQVDIRKEDDGQGIVSLKGEKDAVASATAWMDDKIATAVTQQREFQKRQQSQEAYKLAQDKARADRAAAEASDAAAAEAAAIEAEQKPKAKAGVFVPVGGEVKLNKNQRRRERKRTEKQEEDGAKQGLVAPNAYGPGSAHAQAGW